MKNPTLYIKEALSTLFDKNFQVQSKQVEWFSDPPAESPVNYCWVEDSTAQDLGTKEDFVTELIMVVHVVTKVNMQNYSSLFLEQVCDHVQTTLIARGGGTLQDSDDFTTISTTIEDVTPFNKIISGTRELSKAIRIRFIVNQLN